MTTKDI